MPRHVRMGRPLADGPVPCGRWIGSLRAVPEGEQEEAPYHDDIRFHDPSRIRGKAGGCGWSTGPASPKGF